MGAEALLVVGDDGGGGDGDGNGTLEGSGPAVGRRPLGDVLDAGCVSLVELQGEDGVEGAAGAGEDGELPVIGAFGDD